MRKDTPFPVERGDDGGAWVFVSCIDGKPLHVIASWGMGWDHVSVSRANRCPNWQEMEQVAKIFFYPHEAAMQLHLPEKEHINCHPFCLHWWRPQEQEIPKPPDFMVGPKR